MAFFRILLALVGGFVLNRMIGQQELAFFVYLLLSWLLVYLPGRKPAKKAEFVADSAGNATSRRFWPAEHPGYKEVFSDSNGRSFVNGAGNILCTRYVTQKSSNGGRVALMIVVAVIGMLAETFTWA